MTNYTIQSGDNLWNIAKKQYNLKNSSEIQKAVSNITKYNNILDSNTIFAGNKIELPENFNENNTIEDNYINWVKNNNTDIDSLCNGTYIPEDVITEREFTMFQGNITTNKDEYLKGTQNFAQELYDSWNNDNKEGVILKEYEEAEHKFEIGNEEVLWESLGLSESTGMSYKDNFSQMAESNFNFLDLNKDKKIETKEIQSIYASYDSIDGKTDGKFKQSALMLDDLDSLQIIKDIAQNFYNDYLK